MKEIKAIVHPSMLEAVIAALKQIPELPGVTVSEVKGFGRSHLAGDSGHVTEGNIHYDRRAKLEIVVPDGLLEQTVKSIQIHAHRGRPGDGKIFVYTVDEVVNIRTGEHDREQP
jgi:nitrogen regulatory protein P-II 1